VEISDPEATVSSDALAGLAEFFVPAVPQAVIAIIITTASRKAIHFFIFFSNKSNFMPVATQTKFL